MELIKNLVTKGDIFNFFVLIIAVAYAFAAAYLLKRIQARKTQHKKDFFETSIRGLLEGTIETTEDLLNIYKGVTNLSSEYSSYGYGLNRWLREIMAQLISRKIGSELDTQDVIALKNKISDFIITNDKNSPFADLPDSERNILSDLSSYSNNGDRASVFKKINELSIVIQTRYEEQKKLEAQNKWSIPLAIIGLVLTVIFGIISLF